jgi:hypothetical protein
VIAVVTDASVKGTFAGTYHSEYEGMDFVFRQDMKISLSVL